MRKAIIPIIAAVPLSVGAITCPANSQGLGWVNAQLKNVEVAAARGDRNAELELGKRYESGTDVPQDFAKAEKLYRTAANPRDRFDTLSAPTTKHGFRWRVTTNVHRNGVRLPEAEERLANLLRKRAGR